MNVADRERAMRDIIGSANDVWKKVTGQTWSLFLIDALAYIAEWLCLLRPELARDFLAALADVHRHDLDREGYERARKMIDVRRRELIESFEMDAERTKQ
jgi:hypothetical protein